MNGKRTCCLVPACLEQPPNPHSFGRFAHDFYRSMTGICRFSSESALKAQCIFSN